MATGKSSFARNYDKILAALSVVLLAGAIVLLASLGVFGAIDFLK